ncbi:MAG: imidazolonepropionase [Elusimicrobiota bacterium]|jgi:imidazolonepropionase|nr:imidazolonepropionase [Elusimicrobiota bacterium]
MQLLVKNIDVLAGIENTGLRRKMGKEMKTLTSVKNAYLTADGGKITGYGKMEDLPANADLAQAIIDAKGGIVLPAFCDSHTHIVYAGSREGEFVDKINGLSYEEIAKRGGGILNSAELLHNTSEDSLFDSAFARLKQMLASGIGSVEIKSGYGLNTQDEIKMLRVIKRLKAASPMTIKSTFLGAHAVPKEYKGRQSEYVDLICKEMIPAVAKENLADFIDVFCDVGFFTPEETAKMLEAGAAYGLRPKIHANELAASGGIQIGVAHKALSVDHLEFTGEAEIAALLSSQTMPTLLPGAAFFLEMNYPPARKMIDSGLGVALATDYNPGSSPSGNMKFVLSLACIKMKMSPQEAINAATLNGAYAMGLEKTQGSITVGKRADLFVSKPVPSLEFLPYAYGSDLTAKTILGGEVVFENKN